MKQSILIALVFMALGACAKITPSEEQIERNFKVYTGTDKIYIQLNKDFGYASATGIWTVEGDDKIQDPINISDVFCHKEEKYCEDRRAWVSNATGIPTLMSSRDIYEIKSWSDKRVSAELSGQCRIIQLQISTEDTSVTTITRNAPGCSDLPKPRLTRLISGKELDDMRKQH